MSDGDAIGPAELLPRIAHATAGVPAPPLAIYVHLPFCASKCHFCDWVVDVPVGRLRSGREARRDYLDALVEQVSFYGPQLTRLGYRPDVMYWGGGTPARLEPDELARIHDALDASFDLSTLRQWTVETTPNDLTADRIALLRARGMDRMSLGVQSLDVEQLRVSGRAHTREQSLAAMGLLRREGIENFNVDLISSFPGRDRESFARTLDAVLAESPTHISVYPYRATPETVTAMQLGRRQLAAHDVAAMIDGYELAMRMLGEAGYHEYCHGYWVRSPEHEDQDGNHKYDLAGDKIGFGSGAESVIGHHLLWNETGAYRDYLGDPRSFTFAHRFDARFPERMTAQVGGALMTRDGVVFRRFHRLTGVSFADVRRTAFMDRWLGLIEECGGVLEEGPESLRLRPDTVHRAYITHLANTTLAGANPRRA